MGGGFIFDSAPTMSLRGPVITLTARREAPSFVLGNVYWVFNLEAVFCQKKSLKMFYLVDGMDGMGWDGMDGMGYQKCPSIFFILCGYIDKVYTYLYR